MQEWIEEGKSWDGEVDHGFEEYVKAEKKWLASGEGLNEIKWWEQRLEGVEMSRFDNGRGREVGSEDESG